MNTNILTLKSVEFSEFEKESSQDLRKLDEKEFLKNERFKEVAVQRYFAVNLEEIELKFEIVLKEKSITLFMDWTNLGFNVDGMVKVTYYLNIEKSFSDVHKTRHELISMVFKGAMFLSDKKMSNQTPDDWTVFEDHLLVIDFKTKNSSYYDDLKSEIERVNYKYRTSARSQMAVEGASAELIHSIIVGLDTIASTFELTDRERDLCFRLWYVGNAMQLMFEGLGIRQSSDNPMSLKQFEESLADADSKLVKTTNKKGHISKTMVEQFEKPVDEVEFAKRNMEVLDRSVNEALDWWDNQESHRKEDTSKFQGKMRESLKNESARTDKKTVVQIPLPAIKTSMFESDFWALLEGLDPNNTNPLNTIWIEAAMSRRGQKDMLEDVSDLEYLYKCQGEGYTNKNKSKNYVAKTSINKLSEGESVRINMHRKKFRGNKITEEEREKSKQPFSYNVDVTDIHDYLRSNCLNVEEGGSSDLTSDAILSLFSLSEVDKLSAENGISAEQLCQSYATTKMSRSLSFLTSVAIELNNSLAQAGSGKVVLKKIIGFNAWILIRMISQDKPLNFSICCLDEDCEDLDGLNSGVFLNPMMMSGKMRIYKFVTIERHRISHYLNAFQVGLSIICMMCELFKEPITNLSKWNFSKDVREHSLFSILVYLEDKQQTSADLQMVRFAYMECLTNETRSPLKIHEKLDFRPKSRLLVWIHKQIFNNFWKMTVKTPTFMIGSGNKRTGVETRYENLLSFVTGSALRTAEAAINLSYLGTLHNRDEGDQVHNEKAILKKMIKLEISMRKASLNNLGYTEYVDPDELKEHEFSPAHIKKFSQSLKRHLGKKFPGRYSERHRSRMARECDKRTLSYLATFKSSAEISDPRTWTLPPNDRTKVIDQMIKWYKEESNVLPGKARAKPLLHIQELINYINNREIDGGAAGIYTGIFRKLQIGGPREIFILDICSRIVVHWLETNCRMVCKDTDNEMLTNKNKHSLSERHASFVNSKKLDGYVTSTSMESADASKWSQSFVMPAFSCFVTNFFDKDISKIMNNILDLVTKKKIELPKSVINDFINNPGVRSFSDEMNELKDQYLGDSEFSDLLNRSSFLMSNVSNMMQGILHYLSSLLHAAKQCFVKEQSELLINRLLRSFEPSILITNKVSSDDSSTVRTIMIPERIYNQMTDAEKKLIILCHRACSIYEGKMYRVFCAQKSRVKSTDCVMSDVEEFNSVWNIQGHQISPKFKYLLPSLRMTLNSSLVKRQLSFSNLRRQMKANGCSSWLCSIFEHMQMLVHYDALGARTNLKFHVYIKELLKVPHPVFGLFVKEPAISCGLMGYDHAEYNLLLKNDQSRKVAGWIYSQKDLEILDFGKRSMNVEFLMGNTKNYRRHISELGLNDEWRKIGETRKGLRMMLDKPETEEDHFFYMNKKYFGPSASDSYTFNMSGKMYASGTYVFQTHCITLAKRVDNDWEKEKMTLLGAMNVALQGLKEISMKETQSLFPHYRLYEDFNSEMSALIGLSRMKDKDFVKRKLKIYFPASDASTYVSMSQSVSFKWFSEKFQFSNTELEESWKIYTGRFKWLKETPEETISDDDCPVSDFIGLVDFCKAVDVKPKLVESTAIVSRVQGNFRTLSAIMRKDFYPSYILSRTKSNEEISEIEKVNLKLISCLSDWRDFIFKENRLSKILGSYNPDFASILTMSREEKFVTAMKIGKNRPNSVQRSYVNNIIESLRGAVGFYLIPQKRDVDGNWFGSGKFKGRVDGVDFEVSVYDEFWTSIEVNNVSDIELIGKKVNSLMKRMKFTPVDEQKPRVLSSGVFMRDSRGVEVKFKRVDRLDLTKVRNDLNVDMKGHKLELRVLYRGEFVSILSYYPHVRRFVSLVEEDSANKISELTDNYWYGWKKCRLIDLTTLIKRADIALKKEGINSSELDFQRGKFLNMSKDLEREINVRKSSSLETVAKFVGWIRGMIIGRSNFATMQMKEIDFEGSSDEEKLITEEQSSFALDLSVVEENTILFDTSRQTDLDILEISLQSEMVNTEEESVNHDDQLSYDHPLLDNLFDNRQEEIRQHINGTLQLNIELMLILFPVRLEKIKVLNSELDDLL